MKLVVRVQAGTQGPALIAEAKKVLRDLSACALPQA
jgi:transcription-repair coupling factor (superfamily II helicase)